MPPSSKQIAKLAAKLLAIFLFGILIFGAIYQVLGEAIGNEFITPDKSTATFLDCIYFSVTTATTLGYGDLQPLGWARLVACIEVIFGLVFVGYSISQIFSAKQEALVEYLTSDRLMQTYDECIATIVNAKESIGDRRRSIQQNQPVLPIEFFYNLANPFYPALRAMQGINGYTAHIEGIGRATALSNRIERAANHVEELTGFTRKYVNILASGNVPWNTPRTKQIVEQLCDEIEEFNTKYVTYTRYMILPYKGGGLYQDIVKNLSLDIRAKL
ncbi:hypothetical protein GCM10007862_34420 [Dyella lipolytica]|uniref:Two pore domain potassium channel family protein n=1 Tax=Dyella lipolytica TaxID=1867835 RepID=A0ABW8IYZ8_9GAMM|nr:potassium channel family protein [Dyella lipolytica]GLQ48391.1 hypothetical protein GCM10007862_34420 [Dyella lipolytica]